MQFVWLFALSIQGAYGEDKLTVAATFYPLAHFAEQVGGERVEVHAIIPTGADPHIFEPTPLDLKTIWQANVFILNGANMDPWAEKIKPEVEAQGVATIQMSSALKSLLIKNASSHDDHARHIDVDPHFWLDPIIAIKEIETIRDTLIKIDPNRQAVYLSNSQAYIAKLSSLHMHYEQGLKNCKNNEIIVSHTAFNYLSRRYHFNAISIAGLSSAKEPSPKEMAEIIRAGKAKSIRYVFFEPVGSSKLAKTLAAEINATPLVLNSIGGLTLDDLKAGKTYLSIMEENLVNLRLALDCQ
jgi:zinc transport system substrate-binding protein